jgi:hypothetical protein
MTQPPTSGVMGQLSGAQGSSLGCLTAFWQVIAKAASKPRSVN